MDIKKPNQFSGIVNVPPDKSITHRTLFLSSMADGVSTIENPLKAEDCLSTASCMEALGVKIDKSGSKWTVNGVGLWGFKQPAQPLNCGNSGTTMRLISGILSAQPFTTTLGGDASLSKRPMDRVSVPLQKMGATFALRDGRYAPFSLTGNKHLTPITWKNPIASAQVKSSVLLAAIHAQGTTVYEEPSVSRDHTERMLAACGVPVEQLDGRVIIKGPAPLKPQNWVVPGDISSAAFFIVGAALIPNARIQLKSVNLNPTRTGLLHVLSGAGAGISIVNERDSGGEPMADIVVERQPPLQSFNLDEEIAPTLIDEVPILAVAATQARGTSTFSGLKELRVKETDRLKAIATNLKAMGASVEEKEDGLIIKGPTPLHGATLESFEDHRIAMAFAIAGLLADGVTKIKNAECVAISYPNFWDQLREVTRL